MVDVQWFANFLAFNQYLNFAFFQYCVVNFFAFLRAYIAHEFWSYFCWVKDVISQYGIYEWHYEGVLCRLFGFDSRTLLANFRCETVQFFKEFHIFYLLVLNPCVGRNDAYQH